MSVLCSAPHIPLDEQLPVAYKGEIEDDVEDDEDGDIHGTRGDTVATEKTLNTV